MKNLILTTDQPGEFIDSFDQYLKKIVKKSDSCQLLDEMVDILIRNQVQLHNWWVLSRMLELVDFSKVEQAKKEELAALLEKRFWQDGHPREWYWICSLMPRLTEAKSYPFLIDVVRSDRPRDVRANAMKNLAKASGQPFNRNLPKDPGKWKEEDIRVQEMEAWIAEGCPAGAGYLPPVLDGALDAPATPLEAVVSALNRKLKKNQDPTDFSSYDNYLVVAPSEDVERLQSKYQLKGNYLDFLKRFSPCNVIVSKGAYDIFLYGADNLEENQNGYSVSEQGEALDAWPKDYLVIADRFGDPYCIRMGEEESLIYFAKHGEGAWKFKKQYNSLEEFLAYLAK